MDWEGVWGGGGSWRGGLGLKVWSGLDHLVGLGGVRRNVTGRSRKKVVYPEGRKVVVVRFAPEGWWRAMGKGRVSMLRKCWSGPLVGENLRYQPRYERVRLGCMQWSSYAPFW